MCGSTGSTARTQPIDHDALNTPTALCQYRRLPSVSRCSEANRCMLWEPAPCMTVHPGQVHGPRSRPRAGAGGVQPQPRSAVWQRLQAKRTTRNKGAALQLCTASGACPAVEGPNRGAPHPPPTTHHHAAQHLQLYLSVTGTQTDRLQACPAATLGLRHTCDGPTAVGARRHLEPPLHCHHSCARCCTHRACLTRAANKQEHACLASSTNK